MEESKRGYQAVYKSHHRIMVDNFLGGLAWGLGTVVGASVIVALLAFLLGQVDLIPGIGQFIARVIEVINQYSHESPFQR